MKRRTLLLLSTVVVLGLSGAMLAVWALSLGPKGNEPPQWERPVPDLSQATTATMPKGLVTLRVDFRSKGPVGAKVKTIWDGQLTVSEGRVAGLRHWQADPRNVVEGNSWKLSTRHAIPWNSQQRKRGHELMPLKDGSLVVELTGTSADTRLDFKTAGGDFSFTLGEVEFGTFKPFHKGLVRVSRMANTRTILSAPSEDDFASAASGPDGKLYVAYVAFTHGADFRRRPALEKEPESFDSLAQPTGGDQVLLLALADGKWTGPMPATEPGEDVYRTALAVDGMGRVWVFWSAKKDGNWDLFARCWEDGTWFDARRLSDGAGPDIFPAATTDSEGRVWVAWQSFGGDHYDILVTHQESKGFAEPIRVADAAGNQWTPAVAASSDGRVAVAWDTYQQGNYDVYCRIGSRDGFGKSIAIATSRRAEMRPTATFDGQNRLWVAYEDSPEKWGKDWGAMEKEGVALYQGRSVQARVWAEGQLWRPAEDPTAAFIPGIRKTPKRPNQQKLAIPRLTTDAKGRVWLAVRSPRLGTRLGVGTAFFEHVAWYEGNRWSAEIICPATDNILDNRPALVPRSDGRITLVTSTDGRFATGGRLPQWFVRSLRQKGEKITFQKPPETPWPDAVNNELVMAEFGPAPGVAPKKTELAPLDAPGPVKTAAAAVKEADDVAAARAARTTVAGKPVRLLRGEFHRHTELSGDGGGDGLLLDMWRYGIDAACLDWIGNGDHDNGNGREYSWWITQKTTDIFQVADAFTPLYTYERSCLYPDGHRNVVFPRRGIRTLPRLKGQLGKAMDDLPQEAQRPNTPDTRMLYRYLTEFDGICASHTSGTDMGTDWRDNDSVVEPIVEIYQGCRQNYEMPGAPRSNTAENSLGGWRPFGFVSLALEKGYRLGFQASSDHVSTHISYCNVWAEDFSPEAIYTAMKNRHVYGATDNIIADVRCGEHFMGDEFTTDAKPTLDIRLIGTRPFAKVHVIRDGKYAYTTEPNKREVTLQWTDFNPKPNTTVYYYVRGEQEDGELVWVSPMWIRYEP